MDNPTLAALARRLGVGRSALSNAVQRSKIALDASGKVDLGAAATREYLQRFTGHRGKARTAPDSPEATAAALRKARAQYARGVARLERRKAKYLPAVWADEYERRLLDGLAASLAGIPAAVDFSAPNLERALERAFSDAMRSAVNAAQTKPLASVEPEPPEAERLPGEIPQDAPLCDARAFLDELAARRHDLEHAIESGAAILREDIRRRFSRIDGKIFYSLRMAPRFLAARLPSIVHSSGTEAAREHVAGFVQNEISRLERRESAL